MKRILLASVMLIMGYAPTSYAQEYPNPAVDIGTEGQFLWKAGVTRGRTANLTTIGPYIVNLPEGPGSTSTALAGLGGLDMVDTIWNFADLTNPVQVHEFTTLGMPIQAHATIVNFSGIGARLYARGSGTIGYNQNGTTLGDTLILDGFNSGFSYEIFSHSHMTSPYVTRNLWSYNLDPSGVFAIHDGSTSLNQPPYGGYVYNSGVVRDAFGYDLGTWNGVPYLYWDHFAVANVTGFTSFNGNLMVQASDQLSTGIAIYDIAGMKEGRMPRLLSVYQPQVTQPDNTTIGVGGYWVEPYGATKMVYSARQNSAVGRTYNAMYIIDFEDPRAPFLSCEIYFDRVGTTQSYADQPNISADVNRGDGDISSDPMYVNFQDNYAYLDHFRVDIAACESHTAMGHAITGAIYDEVVYKFEDMVNGCDASQYARPLGQLVVFGGYDWWRTPNVNEQGMCGFVSSNTPDTNAPYIAGHRPLANQADTPIDTFIHIQIPETLRTETVENSIVITNTGNNQTVAFAYQLSHTGTISIFPSAYLAANATYRVDVTGIQDFMGNTMTPYSYTFSTDDGNLLQGETPFPPWNYETPPAAGTITTDFAVTPVDPPPVDPPPVDPTPVDPSATPTYTGTAYFPNQSTPISCDASAEDNDVWVVNPDNDTVTIIGSSINATTLVKTHATPVEITTGYEAPTSVTKIGRFYAVTYRDDDKVVFFNAAGRMAYALDTGHGTQPVTSIGSGNFLYVSLYASGEVIKININNRMIVSRLAVGAKPKAMAMDANRLLVTRFISPSTHGEVYDINTDGNMTLTRTIAINRLLVGDDIDHGGGVPNFLSGIVISDDGLIAYVSATKANVGRGLRVGSTNPQPLDGDNTVRPMLAVLDLVNNRDSNVDPLTRANTLDLDNGADPSAVSFLANPDVRVTALQGNDLLLFSNTQTNASAQFATGGAPQGMCSTRRTLYVKNFTGRTVSAINIADYLATGSLQQTADTISTVSNEVLSAQEKQGLDIFYASLIPEMGLEGYMSCASCHSGGGHDGQVWDMTAMGEGVRNTISLNGSSGTRFGNLHWTQNFNEVQDFDFQIRQLNGGEGLTGVRDINGNYLPSVLIGRTPLGFTTTGLSSELDALAAYVSSLGRDTVKRSPYRLDNGDMSATAIRGKAVFESAVGGEPTCASCHSAPAYRDGLAHNVGTITAASGNRIGGSLTQIRTPTLIELWDSAPYFHNGIAGSLANVMATGTHIRSFTGTQQVDLIEYLLSIDREAYITDEANFATETLATNPAAYTTAVGAVESTANITIRGLADGQHTIKLFNDTTNTVLFNGLITFTDGNASIFVNVPFNTRYTGRYLGINPPSTIISLFGITS